MDIWSEDHVCVICKKPIEPLPKVTLVEQVREWYFTIVYLRIN